MRVPLTTIYLLAALPVGFFAVLLLAYLFYPIPASYKISGAESSSVVERLSFIEKELAVSHEMATRMARVVGVELSHVGGQKDSGRNPMKAGWAVLAGDENGARIFPLDGRVETAGLENSSPTIGTSPALKIYFDKKDSVRASGSGIVSEVVHNNLVNWKVSIQHKNGYVTTYSGNFSPRVKTGDSLKIGEAIGLAAPPRFGSGRLEFGVFKAGQRVNPFAAFLDETTAQPNRTGQKPEKKAVSARKV